MTGVAIARNAAVRKHFHAIVWITLGQSPVIPKLQSLAHVQCTGTELSSELSAEEKQDALRLAMAGKRLLLCLDDLWAAEHESALNLVDVTAGSRVLISTRVNALLSNAHQLELGLPSDSEAARMVLSSAGEEDVSTGDGKIVGLPEIVNLCGRLPLALGIAGRLAASLGLVGSSDWSGMTKLLRKELGQTHSSGAAETGMIRASLDYLQGSAEEQASVKTLLKLFALVPEDTCKSHTLTLCLSKYPDTHD